MPAATSPPAARTEKEEQLWIALKRHIMRERQRKKEEQEAEVEEERLRKEREAREKQDEMTLGETREQIQIYGTKLEELKNEKKQLFLKLKKVLNEDDNRKKQIQKETEVFAHHNMPTQGGGIPPTQLFLPPRAPHPQQQQLIHKGAPIGGSNSQMKRSRSPSPPQGYYKSANTQSYQQSPKHEDGRRGGESNRAVLWNKPSQYANSPGTLFYPSTPQNPPDSRNHPILFSYGNIMPIRTNYLVEMPPQQPPPAPQPVPPQQPQITIKLEKNHPPSNVFHINLDPPNSAQQSSQPPPHQVMSNQSGHKSISQSQVSMDKMSDRSGGYHLDMKHDDVRKDVRSSQPQPPHLPEGIVYSTPMRHISMHSGVMPIGQPPQQPNKPSGSITQNYQPRSNPVNPQQTSQQQQQQPGPIHYPRHRY